MVPSGEIVNDVAPSDESHLAQNSDAETHEQKETETIIKGVSTPKSDIKDYYQSIKSEKTEHVTDSVTDSSRSDIVGKSSPRKLKKSLQIPEVGSVVLYSSQEVSTPSSIREKVSEDGYNWRKYGQKLVKGNEYVRSYYRCTHPNCPVKKQLERTHEGQIVDIVYFGQHAHPRPQVNIPLTVGFAVSIIEERRKEPALTSSDVYAQSPKTPIIKPVNIPQISSASATVSSKGTLSESNKPEDEVFSDDDPDSKRQKKDREHLKSTTVDKPSSEPRLVVQTRSEVDVVNDGYRWRKYGQKLVKGNPNPRSYYRCSNSGCPVKKHVERASHDPKVVITTYEGQHSHNAPPSRIVTYNVSGSVDSPMAHHAELGAKSDGKAASLDLVVDAILEHESKSEKKHKSNLVVEEESNPVENFTVERRKKSNVVVEPSIRSESNNNNSCIVDIVVRESIKVEVKDPDLEPVQG